MVDEIEKRGNSPVVVDKGEIGVGVGKEIGADDLPGLEKKLAGLEITAKVGGGKKNFLGSKEKNVAGQENAGDSFLPRCHNVLYAKTKMAATINYYAGF